MGVARMNPELEKQLEAEIDRALRGHPDLAAPPGLLARTLSALEQPEPWHVRPWSKWPVAVRVAFLFVTLAAVAVAVMGWRAVEPGLLASAYRFLNPAASGLRCFWDVLTALASGASQSAQRLGVGFMLACLVAVLGASAACAGFGTFFVRLALTRPEKNKLRD
jgi:hypothetical protein